MDADADRERMEIAFRGEDDLSDAVTYSLGDRKGGVGAGGVEKHSEFFAAHPAECSSSCGRCL